MIMAGGKGERLWPLSNPGRPKQLIGFDGRGSLVRQTLERLHGFAPFEKIWVMTGIEIANQVAIGLPELPGKNIIAEPFGRNTAPCIAFAASLVARQDKDGIMAVFPSDHMIADTGAFRRGLDVAIGFLEKNPHHLLTLGIVPSHPETGYGYIEPGEIVWHDPGDHSGLKVQRVQRFIEKPDIASAKTYVDKGCLWNAGMFVWRVDAILKAFERDMPVMHKTLMDAWQRYSDPNEVLESFYSHTKAISVDYAIMEKADNAVVIPVDIGWNDIGSWDALGKVLEADSNNNAFNGDVVFEDSGNNVVWAGGKRVVLLGMEDTVVVEGDDAILVCPRSRAQEVSGIAKKMNAAETKGVGRFKIP